MDNNILLEYALTQVGSGTVVFLIENQAERLTNYLLSNGKVFTAKNGWRVAISEKPEIDPERKVIFLRGSKSKDDSKPARIWGLKDKAAKEIIKAVHTALEEAVTAAKNWQLNHDVVIQAKYRIIPVTVVSDPFANLRGNKNIFIL